MGRILAIGDIHGCSFALNTLLEMIDLRAEDTLVTLGDYVARGPDTKKVIDCLLSLVKRGQLIPLKGNHEVMMLEAKNQECFRSNWLEFWGKETLKSYNNQAEISLDYIPGTHWDFLENTCLNCWETEKYIFVHANLKPHLSLHKQSEHSLFWDKFYQPQPHYSGKVMVCGHTSQKDGLPISVGYAVCLDTWAYGEGWLTCLDMDSGKIFQANQQGEKRTTNIKHYLLSCEELATLYRVTRKFQ
ncbi:MAG TPA: serine/threonine protein phosphatase [Cyanothece sp. UBA12306]|nr:serine/threonine protein phosphatase [Cyanothece sp. UBA12306]